MSFILNKYKNPAGVTKYQYWSHQPLPYKNTGNSQVTYFLTLNTIILQLQCIKFHYISCKVGVSQDRMFYDNKISD
jgi:hypothetical protein